MTLMFNDTSHVTPAYIYDMMGWKHPDEWIARTTDLIWREAILTGEMGDYTEWDGAELISNLARRSGRTTQMIVHGICKAMQCEKVLLVFADPIPGNKGEDWNATRLIETIWNGLRGTLPYTHSNYDNWIRCTDESDAYKYDRKGWATLVLRDHWLDEQELHE